MLSRLLTLAVAVLAFVAHATAQSSFVNWENPHVHPLDLTPDGTKLVAVNTADARLEVFDTTGPRLVRLFDVAVGIDPVSVRARTNDEVWVVNHISDSVSIVKLSTRVVVATIKTDDEPADVVFAGTPQRAFVSCSQVNKIQVFDPANTQSAPINVPIVGEEPRSLAVSLDGTKVYVAIFESGNATTILGGGNISNNAFPRNAVNDFNGPYSGQNPPPNVGTTFVPPIAGGLPTPPKVGLIVKKSASGLWLDDNARNWTSKVSGANAADSSRIVGWDLADNDVAILNASNPTSVTYAKRLMNLCMALAVNPISGEVTVVGLESTNEIRFEPNVQGKFVKVEFARVDPSGPTTVGVFDLNPHITYATPTVTQNERDRSIGDPRAVAWESNGTRAWIAGMGSDNVVVVDQSGARTGLYETINVPAGPTGLVIHDASGRVFVLSKFAASVSAISLATQTIVDTLAFHDASPTAIKSGRRHMYDTHATSGLGQASCASCHVDTRMDGLAWDLGDPSGAMSSVVGNNLAANLTQLSPFFEDFHPMKGPMTTQTLQDIIGLEPFHWRGDRKSIEEFNPAYQNLQGDDAQLTVPEMAELRAFLATIYYPPNPYRNLDNTLPTSLPLPAHLTTGRFAPAGQPLPNGNAQTGLSNHRSLLLFNGSTRCVTCHTLPTGVGTDHRNISGVFQPIAVGPAGEHHTMLVASDPTNIVTLKPSQLRNMHEKTGFFLSQTLSTRGFGYLHDGAFDTLERFLSDQRFSPTGDAMIANLTAFMLSFSGSELPAGSTTVSNLEPPGPPAHDTHAAVGRQFTLRATPTPSETTLLNSIVALADANKVGLIANGVRSGLVRGAKYVGSSTWQSDRAVETFTTTQLTSGAAVGSEMTFTVVPSGTETRLGTDRDLDGWRDRDEVDIGSDPANAAFFPGASGIAFCFGDDSGTACPCGNASSVGDRAGCLNSNGTAGKLVAAGTASISNDTLVLSGSGMPNGGALYFQGMSSIANAAGSSFGDGLLCAGGTIQRIGVHINVSGASQFPQSGDPSVSVAGTISAAGLRSYQAWYRDALNFCTASTFNLTNAWWTVWAP
ncbi:MAG: YncE family protein [Planctomycetota bacterium]|nr:YncE family protein [Planctomycetota bacterium]